MAKRKAPEINAGSMADIAFLLLIFFLVTTTIANDAGLQLVLPPHRENTPHVELLDKNVLAIRINSMNDVMVEGERVYDISTLDEHVVKFVLNNGKDPQSSSDPEKAVVSVLTDRATSHKQFIQVLDEIHQAYNVIYAHRLGISLEEWKDVLHSLRNPVSKQLYDRARGKQPDGRILYPMQISISEPINGLTVKN